MIFTEELRWTLFPDLHSEYDRFARAVEYHYAHTDMFGILGDVVDGPYPRKTIALIRSLGDMVVTISGNHEWVLRNAMSDYDTDAATAWAEEIWPKYEVGMLAAYGLHKVSTGQGWKKKAELLRSCMEQDGTLQWLDGLPTYLETPSFVGIHAGPYSDVPWVVQAEQLDVQSQVSRRIYEQPDQLFSKVNGRIMPVPSDIDGRVFITGHMHADFSINQRRLPGRIGLASRLTLGDPLYTWTSEDDVIHEHAV